jgi:transposase
MSGLAPVQIRSGKSCSVRRRRDGPKFLRQTFHEYADHSRKRSLWAKAYYRMLRGRGLRHNAAVRALAFKWLRILLRFRRAELDALS